MDVPCFSLTPQILSTFRPGIIAFFLFSTASDAQRTEPSNNTIFKLNLVPHLLRATSLRTKIYYRLVAQCFDPTAYLQFHSVRPMHSFPEYDVPEA
jgi:hypothetical protein